MSGINSPKLSFITVSYNCVSVIEETILSVINQNYQNIEYIIIDGGSQDGTVDIIKKYQDRIAYWVSEPDGGIYDAMNKGTQKVSGDWVFFLGAGDVLVKQLEYVASFLKQNDTLYYGDVVNLDTQKLYNGKFNMFKLAVNNICHQAIFYPAWVFAHYKYEVKYKVFADHIFNMKCFGDKRIKFKYIPVVISIYEGGGVSAVTNDQYYVDNKLLIIKDNFPTIVYYYAKFRRQLAKLIKSK